MAKDKPWFKLYAETYLGDPDLSLCSLAVQGALVRLMCYAHLGSPYGWCTNGGVPMDDRTIAHALRVSTQDWQRLKAKLVERRRVVLRESDGCVGVPRMVRDGPALRIASLEGALGGNPKLTRSRDREREHALGTYWQQLKQAMLAEEAGQGDKNEDIRRLYAKVRDALGQKAVQELRELAKYWREMRKKEAS
jgi:hypothetical protein